MTLEVVAVVPATLEAAARGDEALGEALRADVAAGWNGFPEALQSLSTAAAEGRGSSEWGTRFFLLRDPRVVVGWGGFKGPPADGIVEIGYEIAPGYRGRGLATGAARALVEIAFASGEVSAVVAETLPEESASTRVLEKTGFRRDGEGCGDQDDAGATWRFRLDR